MTIDRILPILGTGLIGAPVVAVGRQRRPLHPVRAEDVAAQVARAFATEAAANCGFYVHGPEELTGITRVASIAGSWRRKTGL